MPTTTAAPAIPQAEPTTWTSTFIDRRTDAQREAYRRIAITEHVRAAVLVGLDSTYISLVLDTIDGLSLSAPSLTATAARELGQALIAAANALDGTPTNPSLPAQRA